MGVVIGADMEWSQRGIDVLGLSWNEGRSATAVHRDERAMGQFLEVLRKADVVVGQNFVDADLMMLKREGLDVSGFENKVFDTRLAVHCTHGHLAGTGSYDLRSLVLLLGSRQGERFPLDFKQYESDLHRTCAMDSAAGLWLYPTLDRLVRAGKLEATLRVAHQCAPIFAQMRDQGVRLDPAVLRQIHDERKTKTAELIERYHLWEERGKKVIKKVPIWRSDKVLDIFEGHFGLRPKDRQRKTWSKLVLDQKLSAPAREFAGAMVDLGQGANDAHWLGRAEEGEDGELSFGKVGDDGFIHPRYDICGSPDRAIASGPNIQNFPRPGEDPRPVPLRRAVVPLHDGHLILGADFSSLETITNAYEHGDMDRVRAVLEGRLSHEGTATMLNNAFGLSLTRQQAKACSHGFDKGESPYNLARTLFKTERPSRQQVTQCQAIFNRMLAEFPKMSKFRDQLWERSVENPLVVHNSFGRRLACFSRAKYGDSEGYSAKHDPTKKYWCSCPACAPRRDRFKYAIAFIGRSAGFDALLRAMAKIYYERRLDEFSLPYLEIHDELDYSVPADRVEHYAGILKMTFEEALPELGGISLPASVVWGADWSEAH